MESNRWFVEDVEDAAEAEIRSAWRRLDARWPCAAGERGGGAIEREVAEADGVEELEAFNAISCLQPVGDDLVATGELHSAGGGEQGALQGQRGEVGDALTVDGDGEGTPGAGACRGRRGRLRWADMNCIMYSTR